jgi:hypothetical protein
MRYYRNAVAAVSANVVDRSAKIRAINITNTDSGALTFQLFDDDAVPQNNDVPIFEWVLAAGAHVSIGAEFFGADGYQCRTGLSWGTSTAKDKYTANGSAKLFVAILYN